MINIRRLNSILFLMLLIFISPQGKTENFKKKYPALLLNSDYGILSESDFKEAKFRPVKWQCFLTKNVSVKYRKWRDSDPMGPSNVIVTMCDFEIWNKTVKPIQVFGGRRAKEVSYCDEFKEAFRKITRGEKYLCVRGEPIDVKVESVDEKKRPVRSWIWDRIKSKKGCYEYFGGDCSD